MLAELTFLKNAWKYLIYSYQYLVSLIKFNFITSVIMKLDLIMFTIFNS